ncbi:hypothetical protein [Pontimicrobium sp. MEBiC01747]
MQLRGVVPNKHKLITLLEQTYTKATSQADFYKRLQDHNLKLYSRNGKITGIQSTRKFRFTTLGYDTNILKELDTNLSQNKRLDALKRIRKHQDERGKEQSKGRERTRKRGR